MFDIFDIANSNVPESADGVQQLINNASTLSTLLNSMESESLAAKDAASWLLLRIACTTLLCHQEFDTNEP